MSRPVLCFAVIAAAMFSAAIPAQARHLEAGRAVYGGEPDPPEGYQPALSAATGRLCVKQCPADNLPCDPPAFKIADGRCTTQWR